MFINTLALQNRNTKRNKHILLVSLSFSAQRLGYYEIFTTASEFHLSKYRLNQCIFN